MDSKTKLLRIEDVATKLNVSQKSVRRYIHSGKLLANKIGGVYRVEESALEYFVQKSLFAPEIEDIEIIPPKSTKTDSVNWIDISDEWDNIQKLDLISPALFCGAVGMAKGLERAVFIQVCGLDCFKEVGLIYGENFFLL